MVWKIDGRKMCNLCAGSDSLNAHSASTRVEAQKLAASAEIPVQLSARHLTLDGDRQIGLDGVARGVDAKPDGGIEGNLNPAAGSLERSAMAVAARERGFDSAAGRVRIDAAARLVNMDAASGAVCPDVAGDAIEADRSPARFRVDRAVDRRD